MIERVTGLGRPSDASVIEAALESTKVPLLGLTDEKTIGALCVNYYEQFQFSLHIEWALVGNGLKLPRRQLEFFLDNPSMTLGEVKEKVWDALKKTYGVREETQGIIPVN